MSGSTRPRHGSASSWRRKNGTVVAVIEDDGAGFDPDRVGEESLGLAGIRERVGLLGGRLRVETAPGKGTTLAVEVPLP